MLTTTYETSLAQGKQWTREDCDKLKASIEGLQTELNRVRQTYGVDSFSEMSSNLFGLQQAIRVLTPPAGEAFITYAADSLTISGAVLGSGPISRFTGVEVGIIATTASGVTNAGLAVYHFDRGNRAYGLMHGVAAITDGYSVAATHQKGLIKLSAQALDVGKAGIATFLVLHGITASQREFNQAHIHYTAAHAGFVSAESMNIERTERQQELYDRHCK